MAKKEKYTEQEMREKMIEIKTGRRVFDTEKYGLLQIRFPKVEENRLADWEYSKVFNQAVLDGIPTNKEMQRLIEERQLWTEQDEKKIQDLKEEISKQIVVLSKMGEGTKNFEKTQAKIDELRAELFQLQHEKQKYFNNTAESKADEAKLSFLIHKCTEFAETGKPVWATYADFKNEEDQETVNIVVYQFMTFINGLPADFLLMPSTGSNEESEEEKPE